MVTIPGRRSHPTRWRTGRRSGRPGPRARRGCPARASRPPATTPTRSARSAVDSRWAMTIDGAALHQPVHGVLDQHLGAGVEAGGGLVEHQHGRVGQRGPGQRHELLLPRRQPASPARAPRCRGPRAAPRSARARRWPRRAASTSASVAPARARRTLSRIVPLNRKPSWGTTTIRSRSDR